MLQNVELGLEAKGVGRWSARERAERAIDLIGLDGFESAYPKELSGGMRHASASPGRCGGARGAVDGRAVLGARRPDRREPARRADGAVGVGRVPIRAIVLVTHNIEEAVLLADRVIILGSKPGRIRMELDIGARAPAIATRHSSNRWSIRSSR